MPKILFIPLNTNHVMIFREIIKFLEIEYVFVCHDRISESSKYHTEILLQDNDIPFCHFEYPIVRKDNDSFARKISIFYKIKNQAYKLLNAINPDACVLAMDNDPIALSLIAAAKRLKIKSILVQEALLRPFEYADRKVYLSDWGFRILSSLGIYLKYSMYGAGGCDLIVASGSNAVEVFQSRGVPQNRISVVGYPKYDSILNKIQKIEKAGISNDKFLYAASTSVIGNEENILFLKNLVDATCRLGINLIIKLHPRGTTDPSDISAVLGRSDTSNIEIIKEGDDTFSILARCYALITVSSTSALEALLMDKECILINYLAGESRLEYGRYNAVFGIENTDEINTVLETSMSKGKPYKNKVRLLEDELYRLDGQASKRVANILENLLN